MTARELKIGNYLHYDGKVTEITGIHPKGNMLFTDWPSSNWKEIERFSPILITKKWLVKFGAKKNIADIYEISGTVFDLFKVFLNPVEVTIGVDSSDKKVYIQREIEHIRYVHQLQNLYFALTGEELNHIRKRTD